MKKIKLTKGYDAIVDDDEYDRLNKLKWYAHKTGNKVYAKRGGGKSVISMHRLVINLTDPSLFVDHIDGNGLNNQKSNLRPATQSQNQANRGKSKNKYMGVYLTYSSKSESSYRWRAQCTKDCKKYMSPLFKTEKEAALWYNQKATELHGEFAKLNIIFEEQNGIFL